MDIFGSLLWMRMIMKEPWYWKNWLKLARFEDFFDAVDSDNFSEATSLMKQANIDPEIMAIVLKKMRDGD